MPAFILPMVKFYDAIGKWLHLKTFRSKFVSKYFSHQDLLELVKSSFREVCNLTDLTAKPLPLSLLVNCLRKLRNIKQQLYSSVHPFCLGQWSFSQNIFSDSFEIYFTTRTCWLSFCHFQFRLISWISTLLGKISLLRAQKRLTGHLNVRYESVSLLPMQESQDDWNSGLNSTSFCIFSSLSNTCRSLWTSVV